MQEKPLYQHHCEVCVFLGHYRAHDLYFCPQYELRPTILARYGNDGPEYISGIPFAEYDPIMRAALERARERGLLK